MTITDFLLLRITEDERVALAVQSSSAEREAKHIIRHDPARVLAECKAKRAIIELHKPWGFEYSGGEGCGRCGSPDNYAVYPLPDSERFPCDTLRLLASVYADHPDYEQAWRT